MYIRTTLFLCSVIICTVGAGCNKEQSQAAEPKPPLVQVSYPVVKKVTDYEEVTGRTDAIPSVDLRPIVTGYLTKAPFKDGAMVKKGDLLFEIDPEPFDAELAKAEANCYMGKAHVIRMEADFNRAVVTRNRGVITAEEFDKYRGDLEEARASVKGYEAAKLIAKKNLSYTVIRAPFDGRISRRMLDPGNLVKANDTLLTNILSLDPMYAYFDVDERTWLRVLRLVRDKKIKSLDDGEIPITLALADEEDFPHSGVINFAENKLDPGTGTMRMRGEFPNPGGKCSHSRDVRAPTY